MDVMGVKVSIAQLINVQMIIQIKISSIVSN